MVQLTNAQSFINNSKGLTMNTKQPKQYSNTKPPYLDKNWQYQKFNDVLARFKAMGWTPPSEKKGKQ